MKICFFSKYPPIEGGVSSATYWLARALGKKGIEIHIVTNALEVEENWREKIDWENLDDVLAYQPDNVFVHSLDLKQKIFHIPYSPAYLERLVNQALRVIEKYKCDLIDSWYILPYGLAGYFTKLLTEKPFILRHAGSDITRLYQHLDFRRIFLSALKNADQVVTQDKSKIKGFQNLYFFKPPSPDPEFFNPEVAPFDLSKLGLNISEKTPIITYIGKYNQKFKGLYQAVNVLNEISEDFFLLLVSGGRGIEEFESYLENLKGLKDKYKIIGFLPPWYIPKIIKRSACILQLETDFPIKIHWPSPPQEAMACGKPCLFSEELYEKFKKLGFENKKNVLVVNPHNSSQTKEVLEFIISNPEELKRIGNSSYQLFDWQKKFKEYLEDNVKLYEKVISQTGNVQKD